METALKKGPADGVGAADRDRFLGEVAAAKGSSYVESVRALNPATKKAGTAWLQAIVSDVSMLGGFNL